MTTSDRKRPASGKRDSEREMSSLGDVRQVKVGLATKIALPVSGLAALVIVVFGMTVYSRLADGLDEELDRTGVFAARLAASPEIDSWVDSYNTVDDLRKRLADVEAEYAIARGVVGGAGTTAGEREIASKLARYDENQRAFNRRRLERLRGSEGALDVLIVNDKQELVATATGLRGAQIKPWHRRSVGDTVVESVAFAPTGGETVAARTFAHPILNRRKEEVGKATVVFSEENLEAQLADLRTKVAIFCVFGALAAGAVAFFTARGVTSPLKRLLKDIEAVAHGDLAHRTYARSHDEIGVVAATFDAMTRNLERAEGMRLDLADKEREVDIAREVQDRLFPAALPKPSGLLLDAKNRLAGDLSSDLFDVLPTPGPRVTLLTMTTAGRGVPAAIVLSMARSLARAGAPLRRRAGRSAFGAARRHRARHGQGAGLREVAAGVAVHALLRRRAAFGDRRRLQTRGRGRQATRRRRLQEDRAGGGEGRGDVRPRPARDRRARGEARPQPRRLRRDGGFGGQDLAAARGARAGARSSSLGAPLLASDVSDGIVVLRRANVAHVRVALPPSKPSFGLEGRTSALQSVHWNPTSRRVRRRAPDVSTRRASRSVRFGGRAGRGPLRRISCRP
jgi:HAMP domain-containing protein